MSFQKGECYLSCCNLCHILSGYYSTTHMSFLMCRVDPPNFIQSGNFVHHPVQHDPQMMKLTVTLMSYLKYCLCLIKQSGWSDFNKNNFKPYLDKRGNQINFHIDAYR